VSLDPQIREQLQKNTEKCTQEAARLLIEEENHEAAKEKLAYVKIARQLLGGEESPHHLYLASFIAFLCLLLVGFAVTVHIPSTEVGLEIEAETVSFQLNRDWSNNVRLAANSIYINNLERLVVSGLGIDSTPAAIELTAKKLTLPVLGLTAESQVEIEIQGEKLSVYVKNGEFRGEIYAANAHLILENESETIAKEIPDGIPETLEFVSLKQTLDPVKVELDVLGKWYLSNLQVNNLYFAKENFPGSGHFVSSIQHGQVKLLETGQSVALNKGEQLSILAKNSKRLEISRKGERLGIVFYGTVSSIKAGPDGFERNLAPTWLEYLYHQKRLTLFWSSVVFLWGLFWSARNFHS